MHLQDSHSLSFSACAWPLRSSAAARAVLWWYSCFSRPVVAAARIMSAEESRPKTKGHPTVTPSERSDYRRILRVHVKRSFFRGAPTQVKWPKVAETAENGQLIICVSHFHSICSAFAQSLLIKLRVRVADRDLGLESCAAACSTLIFL